MTFDELETNNYGYSIRNSWESYKMDDNLVIVEQNFTRFLKDSTIMGPEERTASYILSLIEDTDIEATRIAYGVPMGGELEYVDSSTLTQALNNRSLVTKK